MSPNPMFAQKTQMHLSKFPIIGHTVSNSNIPFTAKVSYVHADNTLNALEAILFPRAPFASPVKKYDFEFSPPTDYAYDDPFIASLSVKRALSIP